MSRRVMPQAGFYLSKQDPNDCIYCSGTTKGNAYYRYPTHGSQWNYLLWTCVPSVKTLAADYIYSATNPSHLPQKL